MREARAGSTVWLLFAVFACGSCSDSAARPSVTVSDSAGVRIVTNGAESLEEAASWSLTAEPVVDIGSGVDPAVSLFRVMSIAIAPDGHVLIGMTGPPRVLVVDPHGELLAKLGREGDGPGEFMGVNSVAPLGEDSVAVWDAERRRVSVFDTNGRLIREVDLRGWAPLSWIAAPSMLEQSARTYLMPSGTDGWVLFGVGMLGPVDGIGRVEVSSYRLSTIGDRLAEYGPFPGEAIYVSDQTGASPYPLGPDTYGATHRDALIVGTAECAEVRRYSATGELEQIVRWPEPDREVDGERLSAWSGHVTAFLKSLASAERASIQDILDLMPDPTMFPAYTGLVTSESGEVWIGEYYPGQLTLGVAYMGRLRLPERRWIVLNADGELTATVHTPPGFRPMTVRDGRVWGVHTDRLDVESVRAYDIIRE